MLAGVILNLAVWFALHVLFATQLPVNLGPLALMMPEIASLRPLPALIAALNRLMVGPPGASGQLRRSAIPVPEVEACADRHGPDGHHDHCDDGKDIGVGKPTL